MKNFSCFARVIFIVLSWFVFGSLSFGQTERFRHLKLVHNISDLRKNKKYVLITEVDGNAYVLVAREKSTGTLAGIGIEDFYNNLASCLLNFNTTDFKKSFKVTFDNDKQLYYTLNGDLKIKSSGKTKENFKIGTKSNCLVLGETNIDYRIGFYINLQYFKIYTGYALSRDAYLYEYTPTENVGSVTIPTAEGYGTYYLDKAFVMPEGLEGSTISDANHTTGELSLGWEYKAGDVVPAGTALLLKGTYNKKYELFAPEEENVSCSSVATLGASRNYLRGSVVDAVTSAPDGEDVKNYLFYKMYYLKEVDGGESKRQLGFFWGESSGGVFTSSAKRAYMALPRIMANKMKGFALPDAGSTSVQHPVWSSSETNETVYRLDGKKFNSSSRTSNSSGIYIIGGKKVILK